jgi:hypothetical protein
VKRSTELYLEQQVALKYTIVRPGGLSDKPPSSPILFGSADTIFSGSISRQQVAEVLVESAFNDFSSNKIVEIVASDLAAQVSYDDMFLGLN